MELKVKKTKKTAKAISFITRKQADNLQSKLRSAIRATTAMIEKKNLNPNHVKALKKYRKMLQDANNYFGWSVSTLAISK
jgi:hypothetical protein